MELRGVAPSAGDFDTALVGALDEAVDEVGDLAIAGGHKRTSRRATSHK